MIREDMQREILTQATKDPYGITRALLLRIADVDLENVLLDLNICVSRYVPATKPAEILAGRGMLTLYRRELLIAPTLAAPPIADALDHP